MNKDKFVQELSKQMNMNASDCEKINEILESHFIIGRNNKYKILEEIKKRLHIDDELAEKIYDTAGNILEENIKNRLKHPFKRNKTSN